MAEGWEESNGNGKINDKVLMSRTIAKHVQYNSWYISLPSAAKQHVKFWVSWNLNHNDKIFYTFISNLFLCRIFSFMIVFIKRNKAN